MHTKDKLADALMAVGLMDMSLRARGGYYHDFLSPLAMPETQLINDLAREAVKNPSNAKAINDLRTRVINGDFDATTDESDDWAKSEDGQDTLAKLATRHDEDELPTAEDVRGILGDAPIEEAYRVKMQALAGFLDHEFNGDAKGDARKTGFVMMVFAFGDTGRCNYISNGVSRADVVVLMKEMIARFEGQPEMSGTA